MIYPGKNNFNEKFSRLNKDVYSVKHVFIFILVVNGRYRPRQKNRNCKYDKQKKF